MSEQSSRSISKHESVYASRPDYFQRMVSRSQKYMYHIVQEVEKRGMPTEIALLPMIESAFNPQAYSRSKASGIWQFMPSTGKSFGLKQNWWVDNRRNVTAATNAALTYLQKLHVMFGTWDLALAAYNAGEGTVQRAIERNRSQGLPTDYASLPLPAETKNYVPKLMAVKNIMANPEQYGMDIQPVEDRPYFTKVTVPSQIDAHLTARLAEISYEEFSALNPEYKRPVIASKDQSLEVLLPVKAVETFKTNLASYDKPLVSWQSYNAQSGERISNIADKFGISAQQLREVNGISSGDKISRGRPMLVPASENPGENNAINTEDSPTEEVNHIANSSDSKPVESVSRHTLRNGKTMTVKLRTKSSVKFAKVKSKRNLALASTKNPPNPNEVNAFPLIRPDFEIS